MSRQVSERRETSPSLGWKWRDSGGVLHLPRDMETRHLFNTLAMIWNHYMPPEAPRTHRHRRWEFGAHYSKKYMAEAVYHILPELLGRTDMNDFQRRSVDMMRDWVLGNGDLIPEHLRRLSTQNAVDTPPRIDYK